MSGLNKINLNKIKQELHHYHQVRMEVIAKSNEAMHHSKRAIFALHRDDTAEAKLKLELVEKMFKELNKKFAKDDIFDEGAYRAGLEEYVEAKLFYQFINTGKIGDIKELPITGDGYLAGLCDVPGELYRYAIKAATNKDIKTAKKCAEMGIEILEELVEFNLTSYLRTKFDQAKQAVHKLEIVVYELSLRS